MPADLHETSLIALLAIGFVLALLFGLVANLPRVSPIVGNLVAGIAVGEFTPGFVGDSGTSCPCAPSRCPARWRRSPRPRRSASAWGT